MRLQLQKLMMMLMTLLLVTAWLTKRECEREQREYIETMVNIAVSIQHATSAVNAISNNLKAECAEIISIAGQEQHKTLIDSNTIDIDKLLANIDAKIDHLERHKLKLETE